MKIFKIGILIEFFGILPILLEDITIIINCNFMTKYRLLFSIVPITMVISYNIPPILYSIGLFIKNNFKFISKFKYFIFSILIRIIYNFLIQFILEKKFDLIELFRDFLFYIYIIYYLIIIFTFLIIKKIKKIKFQ
jgi:hypothetical protein